MKKLSDEEVCVRKLEVPDIKRFRERIYRFIQIDFVATYGNEASDEVAYSKIDGLEKYIVEGKAHPYGAFLNDEMVGFLWGYIVSSPFEKIFHVAYIATDPDHRKKGIGNALLKKTEDDVLDSKEASSIELIVGSENERAILFYENNDYKKDRYIYRKEIR